MKFIQKTNSLGEKHLERVETYTSPLPIYTFDTDSPVSCPDCGGRTENLAVISSIELHEKCINCGYSFIAILENS